MHLVSRPHSSKFAKRPRATEIHQAFVAPDIRLVATDVDGTLLNGKQELTPRVKAAVLKAVGLGVPVVVATGKPRGPWANVILPQLGPPVPGVFMQGLVIADGNGATLFSEDLDPHIGIEGLQMAPKYGLTFAAYCGERVLSETTNRWTKLLEWYGEPLPEPTADLAAELDSGLAMQKYILLGDQEDVDACRTQLAETFKGRASLTTALPGMVEVLPLGASKGKGLERLLQHMGVDTKHVLAFGDGQNDVEMFNLVGTSVAMGNAVQQLKDVADEVLHETHNEDGVALAIEKYVVQPREAAARS